MVEKIKYPIRKLSTNKARVVVEFTDLKTGTIVESVFKKSVCGICNPVGFSETNWIPHTNKEHWKELI